MTREEAKEYWLFRYENTKDYSDQNWDAQERREHREYVDALLMAIEALSADLVRCKDCKWYISQEPHDNIGKCTYRMRKFLYCREDDFCSYGERREP